MAVRLSALRVGHPFTPRKIPGAHVCQRLSRLQGHSAAGRVVSIEKKIIIRNRTLDLPACSLMPQPTTLPHASWKIGPALAHFPCNSIFLLKKASRVDCHTYNMSSALISMYRDILS
jgi:hypothetical protein